MNDDLVFRFPRDATRARCVLTEARVLEAVAPRLPLAVPATKLLVRESVAWPWSYSAQTRLDGESGELRRPTGGDAAEVIAAALSALHDTPPPRGTPSATLPPARPLLARAREAAALVGIDDERLGAPPPPSPLAPALCHGDLKGEHFLVDRAGRVSGIIDWADASIVDPARDFMGLVTWLGPAFAARVLEHYVPRTDDAFLARVLFYARCSAVEHVARTLRGTWQAPLELVRRQLDYAFEEC